MTMIINSLCERDWYLTNQIPNPNFLPQDKVMRGGVSSLAPFNQHRYPPMLSFPVLSCLRRSFHLRSLSSVLHMTQA